MKVNGPFNNYLLLKKKKFKVQKFSNFVSKND